MARHHHCRPDWHDGASPARPVSGKTEVAFALADSARRVVVLETKPREAAPRVWLGQQAQQQRRAAVRDATVTQPALRDALAGELDAAELDDAHRLWNEHLRSIAYLGGHRTALNILNGSLRHRAIPALPMPDPGALDPIYADGAEVWHPREWNVYRGGVHRGFMPGHVLAGFDINGMYLGAGAIELGTGAPTWAEWPADNVLDLPGWVRVSTLENAPWSIGDRWTEGQWMPTAVAAYLRDTGAEFLISESLVWPAHRRWMDPHVDFLRKARTALMMDGSRAAAALVPIVKDVYARIFGGLLVSDDYNADSATLRPDWRAAIIGTAQARMFRALDRTGAGAPDSPVQVVGIHVDAAWFVMPEGFTVPTGLVVSDHDGPCKTKDCHMLGKFKPAGRVPWTPELHAAWQDDRHQPLWEALDRGRD